MYKIFYFQTNSKEDFVIFHYPSKIINRQILITPQIEYVIEYY